MKDTWSGRARWELRTPDTLDIALSLEEEECECHTPKTQWQVQVQREIWMLAVKEDAGPFYTLSRTWFLYFKNQLYLDYKSVYPQRKINFLLSNSAFCAHLNRTNSNLLLSLGMHFSVLPNMQIRELLTILRLRGRGELPPLSILSTPRCRLIKLSSPERHLRSWADAPCDKHGLLFAFPLFEAEIDFLVACHPLLTLNFMKHKLNFYESVYRTWMLKAPLILHRCQGACRHASSECWLKLGD